MVTGSVQYMAILDAIREILGSCDDFRPRVKPAEIAAGHRLIEDLGIDSVALLDLATGLEACFGLAVDEADIARLGTVGAVAASLGGRLAGRHMAET
jgi:acyl carrier protein